MFKGFADLDPFEVFMGDDVEIHHSEGQLPGRRLFQLVLEVS